MSTHPMRIEQFALWLANGERGLSSSAIVTQLTGVHVGAGFGSSSGYDWSHPHDAGDWRRCELLLRAVPEAREHLHIMRANPIWAVLVDHWDELVELASTSPGFFGRGRFRWPEALSDRIAELLAVEVRS